MVAVSCWCMSVFLFNMFIRHGYLPKTFMKSLLVPLVKCKSGDLSDVNNYRAIAISTALSKLFEHVIAGAVHTVSDGDRYQFGFKDGHSTALFMHECFEAHC